MEICTRLEKNLLSLLLKDHPLQMHHVFTCSQKSCPPVQPGVSFPVLQYVAYRHKPLVHIPSACEADLQVNPEIQSM
jgi:hypothetical protein